MIVYPENPEVRKDLRNTTDLRCAQAHIILGVTLGTTSPKAVGWESIRWRGRKTSTWSAKLQGSTPRRVTQQWYVYPIRMYISTTCHLGHGECVQGSGENDSENLFASYFLQKYENPLIHNRNSKYDANKGDRNRPPESRDVRKGEMSNLPAGERGTD